MIFPFGLVRRGSTARIAAPERPHGVQRRARAEQQLRRLDLDPRMMGKLLGARQPACQRFHAIAALEWVLWRDQPPHLVQAETLQRLEADMSMALVRRIERA